MTELALMFGDRAQSLHEVILRALAAGTVVICDRFTDSTEAYQGFGRGLGSEVVLEMHRLVCAGRQPDLTLYIRTDVATALRRARTRQHRESTGDADEGRFEAENRDFFEKVAAGYEHIAQREPERFRVVDGAGGIDAVHRRVVEVVEAALTTF